MAPLLSKRQQQKHRALARFGIFSCSDMPVGLPMFWSHTWLIAVIAILFLYQEAHFPALSIFLLPKLRKPSVSEMKVQAVGNAYD